MKADEEALLFKETRHKAEEHNRARLKIEEGFCLVHEVRRISEEQHT